MLSDLSGEKHPEEAGERLSDGESNCACLGVNYFAAAEILARPLPYPFARPKTAESFAAAARQRPDVAD
jgi:hypothetical protein